MQESLRLPTSEDMLLAGARAEDQKESLRTGKVFDDRTNDVRVDATNEETLGVSMDRMMESWGQARKAEFGLAVGRCIAVSGKMESEDQVAMMQCIHGKTADEIFAQGEKVTPEDLKKAMSAQR